MKKIINGKVYNTETAKELASRWNGRSERDFNCITETLYRKKTGEYFLHGEGGPNTSYAKRFGNSWGYGERIIPYTEEEAKAWAEKHLDGDEYIDIFGEVEE